MPEGSHRCPLAYSRQRGLSSPLATGAAAAGLWALLAAPPTGFGNLADELEAHAVALHETADAIATQLQELPPPRA